MYLAENIRYLRRKNAMSQDDLADMLGYKSFTTIQKWESGVSEPPLKILRKISEFFKVDMDALADSRLETDAEKFARTAEIFNETHPHLSAVRIPVVRRVAAGIPLDSIEEIIGWEEMAEHKVKGDTYFGLKIQGHSMEPGIMDGDIVLCREQPDAEDGQIVVAIVNGNDGVCKRLKKYNDGSIALMSDNPAYPPIYLKSSEIEKKPVTIRGIVKELRRTF